MYFFYYNFLPTQYLQTETIFLDFSYYLEFIGDLFGYFPFVALWHVLRT